MKQPRIGMGRQLLAGILAFLMLFTQISPASAAESAASSQTTEEENGGDIPDTEEAAKLLKVTVNTYNHKKNDEKAAIPDTAVFKVLDENGEEVARRTYADFKADGYFILTDSEEDGLVAGQTYTIVEEEESAKVHGYSLTLNYKVTVQPEEDSTEEDSTETTEAPDAEENSSTKDETDTDKETESTETTVDNKVTLVDGNMAELTIDNTYTELSTLEITISSESSDGVAVTPDSALITVTDTDGKVIAQKTYGEFKSVGYWLLEELEPGYYTVTESGAEIAGYDLTVTGNGKSFYVKTGKDGSCTINNYYEKQLTPNQKEWLKVCKKVGKKLVKYKFRYNNNNNSPTLAGAISKKKNRVCNCALYASWCLQEYGAIPKGYKFYTNGKGKIVKGFKSWGKYIKVIKVKKTASKAHLQAGDVVCFKNHVAIYAGNNLWYDGGKASTKKNRTNSKYKKVGPKSEPYLFDWKVTYIIRIKGL